MILITKLNTTERKIHNISTRIYDNLETEKLFTARTESEDLKEYVREVIAEMRKSGTKSDNAKSDDFSDQPTE
jgi:hypothetical protein